MLSFDKVWVAQAIFHAAAIAAAQTKGDANITHATAH
jgi:hypothetical protein